MEVIRRSLRLLLEPRVVPKHQRDNDVVVDDDDDDDGFFLLLLSILHIPLPPSPFHIFFLPPLFIYRSVLHTRKQKKDKET